MTLCLAGRLEGRRLEAGRPFRRLLPLPWSRRETGQPGRRLSLLNSSQICCLLSTPAAVASVPSTPVISYFLDLSCPLSPILQSSSLWLPEGNFWWDRAHSGWCGCRLEGTFLEAKQHAHSQLRNLQMAPVAGRIKKDLCGGERGSFEDRPCLLPLFPGCQCPGHIFSWPLFNVSFLPKQLLRSLCFLLPSMCQDSP